MMRVDEEAQNSDSDTTVEERSLPSAWLGFYACTFWLGGLYLLSLLWFETSQFPILTGLLSIATLTTGTLLWLRNPQGLRLYVAIAIAFILFTIYRVASEGYSSGRLGIGFGGLLMLLGYASVAEEIPAKGHTNTMDRSRGSREHD